MRRTQQHGDNAYQTADLSGLLNRIRSQIDAE
jgi:hypothetical protein